MKIICFILALLPCGFLFATPPTDTLQARQKLEQAKLQFDQQAWSQAQVEAEAALQLLPQSPLPLRLQTLQLLGQIAQKQYDFPLAIRQYQQAIELGQNQTSTDSVTLAQIYYDLGVSFKNTSQYHEALRAYQQAIEWTTPGLALSGQAYNSKANVHRRLGEYATAIDHFETALQIYAPLYEKPHVRYGIVYINMGLSYENWGFFSESDRNYQLALQQFRATVGEDHPYTILVYQNLGNLYFHQGDYPRALEFHEQALTRGRQVFGEGHPRMADIYGDMGLAYAQIGKYQQALEHYQEALAIKQKHFSDSPDALSFAYQNLAEVHVQLKNYPQAYAYYDLTLEALQQAFGKEHPMLATAYSSRGIAYALEGKYEQGIEALERARNLNQAIYGEQHPKPAEDLHQLAKIFVQQGVPDRALLYFEQAIRAFGWQGKRESTFEQVRNPHQLLLTLLDKAQCLHTHFQNTLAAKTLAESLETWQQALALLQHLRNTRPSTLSKAWLTVDFYPLFEGALQTYLLAHEHFQDAKYLQEAWTIVEASKSYLLLDALNSSRAKHFAGIPDSLLNQEKELNQTLAILSQEKMEEEAKPGEEAQREVDRLNQQIFKQKNALYELRQRFANQYPRYHQLKYQQPLVELEELQSQLTNEQAILEYFVGDQTLYAILIRSEEISVHRMPLESSWQSMIQQLREGIFAYQYAEERSLALYKNANQNYRKAAIDLYDLLLRPLPQLPEQLIVIPDGLLWSVPFETLLSAPSADRFKTTNYALYQHQFSYNFSATLWLEMQNKTVTSQGLLALAPSFQRELRPLDHSSAEVEYVGQKSQGKVLLAEAATRTQFLKLAPRYSQFHLATHARINESSSDFSYLAFTDQDSTNWKLYIRDLYNLQLPAELVVLSACETGLGTLQKGEAMASLSRGFTYAGAKSILPSLWQVNDQATAKIMASFYDYLAQDYRKDKALRKAKMDYLDAQKEDGLASPFYWGGFVAIGDMEAVQLGSHSWWWALGFFGASLLLWFIKKQFF